MSDKTLDFEAIRKRIQPWLKQARRPTWKPVVEAKDGSVTASKFSGTPWLGAKEPWPTCPGCKKPFQLFLQLNLSKLPKEHAGKGLLQLFYCRDERAECPVSAESFSPFGECKLVRLVHPSGKGAVAELPDDPGYFPAKTIVKWEKTDDWPAHATDLKECGLILDGTMDGSELLVWEKLGYQLKLTGNQLREFQKQVMPCQGGEKLGGWPYWLQDPQRPNCPRCGCQMRFLFQFDSGQQNIPYRFGDSGTGQISQCPRHKEILTFAWAGC